MSKYREYRVIGYTQNKWGQPRVDIQYYDNLKEAKALAKELVAENFTDVSIEVYEDKGWKQDHIEQELVKTIQVA